VINEWLRIIFTFYGSDEIVREARVQGNVSERMFVYNHHFDAARGFLGLGNEA